MIQTNATYLLHDSRQLVYPQDTLFFAIRGERHDGHQYLQDLYEKGLRQFVIETGAVGPSLRQWIDSRPDAQFWQVPDSVAALQQLAAHRRSQYTLPIVGITGSNAKTIVKEWLNTLLSKYFNICKSPKSYNSQIGVPLSVWQLNASHTLGIFEAGVSQSHEMRALQSIIQPTIGVFTNIGSAHDEGFRSRKQKVTEKLQLFTQSKQLIFRANYSDIAEEVRLILTTINPTCELIVWTTQTDDSSTAISSKILINVSFQKAQNQTVICWQSEDLRFDKQQYIVSFSDDASLENLVHSLMVMRLLGIEPTEIQNRIPLLRPVSMRLELKEGINGCYLIDDSYNNDLVGLTMALNFLGQQEQRSHKTVIISDLLQTGQNETDLYQQIAHLLVEKGIDQVLAVGEAFGRNRHFFDAQTLFFEHTNDFLDKYSFSKLQNSLVLVKGARVFQFEKIVNRLQQKTHATVLEVNLDALTHNLNYYRNKVGSRTKIMAMVKAFAYGSGSIEVAQLLQFHRVDYLAVAYTDEGILLRQNGIDLPIMVMNPSVSTFDKMLAYQLEPEIYSHKILDEWIAFLKGQSSPIGIHLKLDTGMHRLGFLDEDIKDLIEKVSQNPNLQIKSVFTHLVGADEVVHTEFSQFQYQKFIENYEKIATVCSQKPIRHILNSAGIVRFPDYKLDMVRLGIGLYGIEANQYEQAALKEVGTLKTVISQIKYLKNTETVGYGRKGQLQTDKTIATVAIGYADGYDRRFGNGVGQMRVNGVLCPVIGNVCMDMTMIDITNASAAEGDEVIVFGNELSVSQLATQINTIPYEILTGVSERVKRVFFKESN
jgi:Alr-MurF fusion protein